MLREVSSRLGIVSSTALIVSTETNSPKVFKYVPTGTECEINRSSGVWIAVTQTFLDEFGCGATFGVFSEYFLAPKRRHANHTSNNSIRWQAQRRRAHRRCLPR